MLFAYRLVEEAVALRCGPTVYPEVGPISTVGLGESLRKTRSPWDLGKTNAQPNSHESTCLNLLRTVIGDEL
jgi:hypothetical protein